MSEKKNVVDSSKKFHFDGTPAKLNDKISSVTDFWKWAYSDLLQNVTRGMIGQYIVAWALGIDNISNDTWQSYDLLSPHGKKIEVKTTSYLQVWKQVRKPIPQFKIRKTFAFSNDTGYSKISDFQADIYTLCYFFEKNKENVDVTNLNQWKFWVFQRKTIESLFEKRLTVRVSELEKNFTSIQAIDLGKAILNY